MTLLAPAAEGPDLVAISPVHDRLRERFPWSRAAVMMRIERVDKVLG